MNNNTLTHKSMFRERSVLAYRRPSPLRGIVWLVLILVICLLGWTAVAKVPEVARTRGQIKPTGDTILVQSLEGGQIVEIMAQKGQEVLKGQPLIRFEPLKTETDVKQLQARTIFLKLDSERLRAFVEQRKPDFSAFREQYPQFVEQQESLLKAQTAEMRAQLQALQEQLHQKENAIRSLDNEQVVLNKQIETATSATEIYKALSKKKIVSQLDLINAQQKESEFFKELEGLKRSREALEKEIQELLEKKKGVKQTLFTSAQKRRSEILSELAEADQRLNERQTTLDRLLITSPVRGVIKSLNFPKPGAVVNPSEVLAEIVPLDVDLMVEVQVSPRDIGFVYVGQPVVIRVDTYDYSRYGVIEGILTKLSPTTFTGPKGELYYVGEVTPAQQHLGKDPKKGVLLPGMTAEIDIITGEKTIFQYLLKPVFTLANDSFKER